MNNLLTKLDIDDGKTDLTDGVSHTFDLITSNKYQKLVETLDKDDEFEIDSDSVIVIDNENSITFQNGEYTVALVANFDTDSYKAIIQATKE